MKLTADLVIHVHWCEHPDPDEGRLLFDRCTDHALNGVMGVFVREPMPYEEELAVLGVKDVAHADQKLKVYDGPTTDN